MMAKRSCLQCALPIFAALFIQLGANAAPLTWFSGPALDSAGSGAASLVLSDKSILVIGGDSGFPYAQYLVATNQYWSFEQGVYYGTFIGAGALNTGDFIVLYGGTDGTTVSSAAIAYSPSGDTPPTLASMTTPRAYLGYAADRSGYGYAIGGLDGNSNVLATVERYNYEGNTWTNTTSMPTPRYDFPAVFDHTNYIYIFGGYTDTVTGLESASVMRYSVSGKTWTTLASMPVATAGSAAALAADGKIYVAGGLVGGLATDTVQAYTPASDTWAIVSSLPEALSQATMQSDSLGRLVLIGGMDVNGYDVADVWRSQLLGSPDTVPVFTAYPTTNASYGNLYSSSIAATGNPQPTYALVSGPNGMAVDSDTGAITWTPDATEIGLNDITIRATNYAGYVDWSYSISISNPAPTILTNLQVVGATETSVTISWDPEAALAGPVTYSAWLRHVSHSPRGSGVTITYSQIGTSTTNTSLTIGGLTPNQSQTYYLKATGSGGSSPYAEISATTLGPQPPISFRMTALTSTSISLAWDPNPGPVPSASYEIWGWYNGGVNYTVYGIGITNTSLTVTGLTPGTSHQWGIRAHDALGYASAFNYGFTAVNPVPAPSTIGGGFITSDGSFQLTITEGASSLETVLIQASSNPADTNSWVQIGAVLPITNPFTFTDTNASQYPSRFYRVIAQ